MNDINALFDEKEEKEDPLTYALLSKASGETNYTINSRVSLANIQDEENDDFCLMWNNKEAEEKDPIQMSNKFLNESIPMTPITMMAKRNKDIISLAKEQLSCRELQKEIVGNIPLASQYFREILNSPGALNELIIHPFGNYFIQMIINMINDELKKDLLLNIELDFLDVSINFYGTRVLQNFIDSIKSESLMTLLIKICSNFVAKMVMNINSSHIIFNLLSLNNQMIKKTIIDQVDMHLMQIAFDKHGSCFIQKIIQNDALASTNIIHNLIKNCITLLPNEFGHYTIKYVFSMKNPYYNYSLISMAIPHFLPLANQKFSSTVLEKCFEICDSYSLNLLYKVINNPQIMTGLLINQYGNYVLQKAIDTAHPNLQCFLLNMLAPSMFALKRDTYGKQLFSKICIKYPSVKAMVNLMKSKGQG